MAKILVVDDEEMMLMMAKFILSKKYEVITALTGAEAIELFQKEKPDLVLSDLMMPELDGYELHRILQEKSTETVPIMFMTGNDDDESEIKGFELGAADYIRKPLNPDLLLMRIEKIIGHLDQIHGLEAAVSIDSLTKLLNKAASQEKISKIVKKSFGALLMIDLDNFKLINDIYGHAAGDKILIQFAKLIKSVIHESDLAGRMGGDEFILFLENVSEENILREKTAYLNEQILISAKKILGAAMNVPLGVSVGAVFIPDEGRDFQMLYKKSDKALYEVKQHGKHGLSIFGKHKHAEKNDLSEITQVQMILSERNVEKSAYFVDFEVFKQIYRLLVRMADNYNKNLVLMEFTLREANFAEEFKEILINSLRKSDCVTKSSENKFLVLLMEITLEESEKLKERIFSEVKNTGEIVKSIMCDIQANK